MATSLATSRLATTFSLVTCLVTTPLEAASSGYQKWLLVLVTPAGIHPIPAVLVDT
ncbi:MULTISPECIES: hypothetical protein [unclassified Leclercia]|uniref:Secreted protein n=1 Tax=Leclercia barmai TaxID=2785629 RepID=A0ABS7S1G7_9ENTR|nr:MULTISPECIES: hypothetical protein [unclassified Leclercia]MBZ0060127.1 hypothetical protein [Leclercia sp. EMC7]MCM5698098.1 hypothetical protein [Leclercia sp. LTM01]MCM5702622.1 hypothetical protein [Leclercia sp. LTM14]